MNFGFQIQRTGGGTIAKDEAISFNTQIINYDSTISYNDGTFSFTSNADYYVSWFVTIKTGLGIKGPKVSLVTNDNPALEYSSTNSMKTGQISGSALVRASDSTTFKLVNKSGESIVLADNVDISASISITAINTEICGSNYALSNAAGTNLGAGAIIPFNTKFIEFNELITNTDGLIDIKTPGKYMVDWCISLESTSNADSIKFNLIHSDNSDNILLGSSESPVVVQCSTYGNSLINVISASKDAPYNISLVNACASSDGTGAEITLSNIGIQANLRIVKL